MKTNEHPRPVLDHQGSFAAFAAGACITATASEQAYDPTPDLDDFAHTKTATMICVKSLAKQFGPKGIRVNGVAPGPVWTPLQVSGAPCKRSWRSLAVRLPWGGFIETTCVSKAACYDLTARVSTIDRRVSCRLPIKGTYEKLASWKLWQDRGPV